MNDFIHIDAHGIDTATAYRLRRAAAAGLDDHASKNPGKLNHASAGAGTGPHLGGELFNQLARVKITHVPYGGAAPAVLGVLGGQVEVSMVNIPPQLQHVKAGKLRPIAVRGSRRSSVLPDVPTAAEAGLPGCVSESWNGLAAPAGTPQPVIDKLYARDGQGDGELPG